MCYTYKYPRPALTVDCIIFAKTKLSTEILLVQRKDEPFKGNWALPGGFVEIDEELLTAAERELAEETSLRGIELKQLQTFGTIGRDPRGRTVSVVYYGFCNKDTVKVVAASDAITVGWYDLSHLPNLAFDHKKIIEFAVQVILNAGPIFK